MARRLFNTSFSIPTLIINRTLTSETSVKALKILGVGAGYSNFKPLGLHNTKESDQEFINALKEKQWDVVAIGAYVNGFDQAAHYREKGVSEDRVDILHWFNRVLNLVHELAPKAKIVLLKGPLDFSEAIPRIMNGEQK
ncbi:hypothetical protein I4U23_003807 [Adineta vaga]|nr:hypothetical protein I4U23_003807 [Adineta vaga]